LRRERWFAHQLLWTSSEEGRKVNLPLSFSSSLFLDRILTSIPANALPETAYSLVNHRIAIEESIQTLKDHYIRILSPLANKWNFAFHAFGKEIGLENSPSGTITLTGHDELEPSPVSHHKDVRFSWLAGTLRGVFGKEVYVAPVLLTGELTLAEFWFGEENRTKQLQGIRTPNSTGSSRPKFIGCLLGVRV
jgi:hypothetical protein